MDIHASRKDRQIDDLVDAAERIGHLYEIAPGSTVEVDSVEIVQLADPDKDTARRNAMETVKVQPPIKQ